MSIANVPEQTIIEPVHEQVPTLLIKSKRVQSPLKVPVMKSKLTSRGGQRPKEPAETRIKWLQKLTTVKFRMIK